MTRNEELFHQNLMKILSMIENTIAVKGMEYRRNNNPFHNFEKGQEMTGQTRYRVLNGFLLKHLVSYNDMLNDIEAGKYPTKEVIEEKLGDIIVYFILQKLQLLDGLPRT